MLNNNTEKGWTYFEFGIPVDGLSLDLISDWFDIPVDLNLRFSWKFRTQNKSLKTSDAAKLRPAFSVN